MVLGSWQLNTVVTVLFLSASLAFVQRCDKDRFCDPGYGRSVLEKRENLIGKGPGGDVKRHTNLVDELWENNWRRTGREDVTRDRLLRAEWHSERRSIVEPGLPVDKPGTEPLDNPRMADEGRREHHRGLREDFRLVGDDERGRAQRFDWRDESNPNTQRRVREEAQRHGGLRREVVGIPERREMIIREIATRNIERRLDSEDHRDEMLQERHPIEDARRQLSRGNRVRLEDSCEKAEERNRKVVRAERRELFRVRDIERVEARRQEVLQRSDSSALKRVVHRREAERQQDHLQNVRDHAEREAAQSRVNGDSTRDFEDGYNSIHERREDGESDRREHSLNRLTERRVPMTNRREVSRQQTDRLGSGLDRLSNQQSEERRGPNDNRRDESSQQIDRINAKRQISREDRERIDDSTERREESIRETAQVDRQGSGLDRLSNQQRASLARSEERRQPNDNRRDESRQQTDRVNTRRQISRVDLDGTEDSTERCEERIKVLNQRHEDFARSEKRREDLREAGDSRRDESRQQNDRVKYPVNVRQQISSERIDDSTKRRDERVRQTAESVSGGSSSDRISNQRREDLARYEERREDSREPSDNRRDESRHQTDRGNARRQISHVDIDGTDDSTERCEDRIREIVQLRVSNQRHENFARSEKRREDLREASDNRRDGARQQIDRVNVRQQISSERTDDSTKRRVERVRETAEYVSGGSSLDRISNQRREDLARSEERREESREPSDNRRDESRQQTDRVNARRQISHMDIHGTDDSTERCEDRIRETVQLSVSNQRHEDFARSEKRREDLREASDNRRDGAREQIDRVNVRQQISSERTDDSTEGREERVRETVESVRRESSLDRISNQRREVLARSDERGQVARESSDIQREASRQQTDQVITRRHISREDRKQSDEFSERREERVQPVRRVSNLDTISNEQREYLERSEQRQEDSREMTDDLQYQSRQHSDRVIANGQISREDDSTKHLEKRIWETVQAIRREAELYRLSTPPGEALARTYDRREDSRGRLQVHVKNREVVQREALARSEEQQEYSQGRLDRGDERRHEIVQVYREEDSREPSGNQGKESRQQISREERERSDDSPARHVGRIREAELSRFLKQGHEELSRSEERREDSQDRADREITNLITRQVNVQGDRQVNSRDCNNDRSEYDSGRSISRESRERSDIPAERREDRTWKLERADRLERISNLLASTEDLQERVFRRDQTNRRENSEASVELEDLRRNTGKQLEKFDERRDERSSNTVRADRLEHSLDRLSNQRCKDFLRFEECQENSRERVDREDARRLTLLTEAVRVDPTTVGKIAREVPETIRADRRGIENRREVPREGDMREESRVLINQAQSRRSVARENRERTYESVERGDEGTISVNPAVRREDSRVRAEDRTQAADSTQRREESGEQDERHAEISDVQREILVRSNTRNDQSIYFRESSIRERRRVEHREESAELSRERFDSLNIHEEQREVHLVNQERAVSTPEEARQGSERFNIRGERRDESRRQVARISREDRADRNERQIVTNSMYYKQAFFNYAKPSLLTMIQGTLLAVVVVKTLSFDNTKFGKGLFFKAVKLTGTYEI